MPEKYTLKQYRLIKGITQKDLAERVGVHETTYLKMEKDIGQAKVSTLRAICKVLGITIDDIFFEDNSR